MMNVIFAHHLESHHVVIALALFIAGAMIGWRLRGLRQGASLGEEQLRP